MRASVFISVLLVGFGLLAGCSHQPLGEQPEQFGEIPDGPGLFSGADGGFYLVGGGKRKRQR